MRSGFRFPIEKKELFLSCLVPLVELVNATGCVDDFHLAGVEGMRCVGNLYLHKRVFNTVDSDRLLRVCAGTGDEHVFV